MAIDKRASSRSNITYAPEAVNGEAMTDLRTKEVSLFSNIVYRLNQPEEQHPAIRRKFCWVSASVLGVVLLLTIVSQFVSANNIRWVDTTVHSLFESYCGIIAFIIAYIIYREYRSSGKRSNLLLFLGFVSMGIFDFFHAYANHCVTLFVWFHTLSAFSGAGFFLWAAFTVPDTASDPVWLRRLFVMGGVAIIFAAAVVISEFVPFLPYTVTVAVSHHIPANFPVVGEFTRSTIVVNVLSAAFFLLSGFYFLKYFKSSGDVLFHTFALAAFLFFESEILFAFSRLWDPSWWYWHVIKITIYAGMVIGIAHGFARTFSELRESRRRLTETITQLKGAYENLQDTQLVLLESEKLASIGKMAAAIAHEIRNPLGAINNAIGIFKRHTRLDNEDRELLDIVGKEIYRLNQVITDFLDFARPSPVEKSSVNLNSLIDETLALITAGDGNGRSALSITRYFESGLPEISADRNAIKQCLWNVFINAIQAMPEGGSLIVSTHSGKTCGAEGSVFIRIRDNGAGMSAETIGRAFQPFFSTKAKGSGLGLPIVRRIVEQHGGSIELTSATGSGTEVMITLPGTARTETTAAEK